VISLTDIRGKQNLRLGRLRWCVVLHMLMSTWSRSITYK